MGNWIRADNTMREKNVRGTEQSENIAEGAGPEWRNYLQN